MYFCPHDEVKRGHFGAIGIDAKHKITWQCQTLGCINSCNANCDTAVKLHKMYSAMSLHGCKAVVFDHVHRATPTSDLVNARIDQKLNPGHLLLCLQFLTEPV